MDPSLFTLQDDRKVAYAEYGNINSSIKILYFHGTPCSRLEPTAWLDSSASLDAHLVAVDRPGLGRSSLHPKRTLLDYPKDMIQLVDHLQWDKFSIVGVSGGGPSALACAYAMDPSRLLRVGVICGTGPTSIGLADVAWGQRLSWWATSNIPFVVKPFINLTFLKAAKNTNKDVLKKLIKVCLDSYKSKDSAELIDRIHLDEMTEAVREAFHQGSEGYVQESFVMVAAWGFDLEEIKSPGRIKMWYGEKDDITPASMGSKMARLLRAELTVMKGLGHGGVFASIQGIIEELISQQSILLFHTLA